MNSQVLLQSPQNNDLFTHPDKGSDAWWQAIAKIGTPVPQALANGDIQVTFLWRDPDGVQSDYARVYLDVYSHTPHPTQQQTSLARVENTDIWLWQTQLPSDWYGSYFLMPAKNHQLPPEAADRKHLRRWWINLMHTNAQADVLNIQPAYSAGWGLSLSSVQLSSIELPDANLHWAWQHQHRPVQGNLHAFTWSSKRLANKRNIWLYNTGTAQNLPLVILLDGHYWVQQMPIFAPLDALTAQGDLPPAQYLFIDALSPQARANELPCNKDFWLALQEELLPQLNLSTTHPQRTLIAGQSFGGLSALYAALHWPETFGLVLSQSGSFWWPDADATGDQGLLVRDVIAGLGCNQQLKVLLDVGCYEADMIGVNRAMCNALLAQYINTTYAEFRGGHDWNCWRHGLLRGLCDLLPAN